MRLKKQKRFNALFVVRIYNQCNNLLANNVIYSCDRLEKPQNAPGKTTNITTAQSSSTFQTKITTSAQLFKISTKRYIVINRRPRPPLADRANKIPERKR
ncbi:hypothetical protein T4D_4827 [Trichinella pseudospiralis]|uniref:Uncharacterized protein n=1 Tax=Trichinella pseudospiralis TaxID=6337 RepID=A0A0V1FBP2_TRIPS|nr:hypothetical protein T4D_4827 [Trichinella pseudospiralis]